MTFSDLGLLEPILQAISEQGYSEPSAIQAKAIPPIMDGLDVMAAAQTGTGKTAGFTLPLLHRLSSSGQALSAQQPKANKSAKRPKGNRVRALILTPTRELAAQVAASVETYGKHLGLRSLVVFGGVSINPQMKRLRGGVDILIATPGRLLDLHSQNAVSLQAVETLVLDEADRMLDMGFIVDIRRIIGLLPKQRQNLLFSATFSQDIRNLAKSIVKQPVEVSVSPPNSTVDRINQRLIAVEKSDKSQILARLIQEGDWYQVLVFCRTKHGSDALARRLNKRDIKAGAIHGNKSQNARTRVLDDFKKGNLRVLVATDIAARGIDIQQLPHVVNYDLPQVAEDYVHRIGRTGRAGAEGEALSLVSHDEFSQLKAIERLIQRVIPRDEIDGYEPANNLPASPTDFKSRKHKKKKKPQTRRSSTRGRSGQKAKQSRNKTPKDKKPTQARPAQGESESESGAKNRKSKNRNARSDQPRKSADKRRKPPRRRSKNNKSGAAKGGQPGRRSEKK